VICLCFDWLWCWLSFEAWGATWEEKKEHTVNRKWHRVKWFQVHNSRQNGLFLNWLPRNPWRSTHVPRDLVIDL
jgi:hypothetical protein